MTNTENNIPAVAGYIVRDHNGAIYGTGKTAAEADADMRRTLAQANIELLAPDADSSACLGSWTREDDMVTLPATRALLDLVESEGGQCSWGTTWEGVACTRDEEG